MEDATVSDWVPWAPPPALVAWLSRKTLWSTLVKWPWAPPPTMAWLPSNTLLVMVRNMRTQTPPPPQVVSSVAPSSTSMSRTVTPLSVAA